MEIIAKEGNVLGITMTEEEYTLLTACNGATSRGQIIDHLETHYRGHGEDGQLHHRVLASIHDENLKSELFTQMSDLLKDL